MKLEIYKDAKKEYRWRLKGGNGEKMATGNEGYKSKQGVEKAIQTIGEYFVDKDQEVTEEGEKKPFWTKLLPW